MNANEFADELEKAPTLWFKDDIAGKWIVEKLRQQQAEIEELKTCLIVEQEHNERMVEDRSKYEVLAHAGGVEAGKKLKELTDAEIRTIQDMCHLKNVGYNTFIMRFARAILRKAQDERK